MNAWLGVILEISRGNSLIQLGMFWDCEAQILEGVEKRVARAIPLSSSDYSQTRGWPTLQVRSAEGTPILDEESVLFFTEADIAGHSDKANFAFTSDDGSPLDPSFQEFLGQPHPSRQYVKTTGAELVQMNISIWNGAVGSKEGQEF
ncbi:hypothetical protein K470DRAFT_272208 [Piedraia hortae CBS 480.64]|uniref:Uncharacterized protein n=1 Tax=Piedraia hortae CBS 480.64 TaxID=1314780 RepID=A0A6A7BU50_9PEZI|nr:hypothetical protein K470DRAFT_272208 [Piedraia hortae CBS 480.64]